MIRKSFSYVAFLFVPLVLCAFQKDVPVPLPQSQPGDERAAQNGLPISNNSMWSTFVKCKVGYDERSGQYSIDLTPEVKSLADTQVTISGFVLPLDGNDQTTHFLLSRRSPVCLYCPPGEPNEVMEVYSTKAVAWNDQLVKATGTMHFTQNGELGVFFQLYNANVVQ